MVKQGGDYVRWDVEVIGGMFGSARLLMAVEDHGAGAQYVRTRIWPRCRYGAAMALILFGLLTLLAALERQPSVAAIFGTFWLVLGLRTLHQAGQATAALQWWQQPPADTMGGQPCGRAKPGLRKRVIAS